MWSGTLGVRSITALMTLLPGDVNLAVFAVKFLFFKRNLLLQDQTPLASRGPQERYRVPRQNPMHSLESDERAPFRCYWQQPLQEATACCVNKCHRHHSEPPQRASR